MYMQHLPFGSVYVIAVKSMEWCGWEENRTQLIRWELCEHTWGRNLILQSEWEEDEMLGVVLLKPPFQLQLFLIFPRNENQSHSKSKFFYGRVKWPWISRVSFLSFLRHKLCLYAAFALKDSFPGNGIWNLPPALYLLLSFNFVVWIVFLFWRTKHCNQAVLIDVWNLIC